MKINYHTHSSYCDGKATPREMVEFAIAHGFTALGFTGHCPLPFENTFSITDYEGYCNEIRALKTEYADRIKIYLGLEMDYVPGMLEDFSSLIEQGQLEYTIGSVHLIPASNTPQGDENLWFIDGPRWERYDERVMLGLRTSQGVDADKLRKDFGNEAWRHFVKMAQGHITAGNLSVSDNGRYVLTRDGIMLSDSIIRDLMWEG